MRIIVLLFILSSCAVQRVDCRETPVLGECMCPGNPARHVLMCVDNGHGPAAVCKC